MRISGTELKNNETMNDKRKERIEKRVGRKFDRLKKVAKKSLAAEQGSKKQKRLDKKLFGKLTKIAKLKQKLKTKGGDDPYSDSKRMPYHESKDPNAGQKVLKDDEPKSKQADWYKRK
jgi:hypothetical protein